MAIERVFFFGGCECLKAALKKPSPFPGEFDDDWGQPDPLGRQKCEIIYDLSTVQRWGVSFTIALPFLYNLGMAEPGDRLGFFPVFTQFMQGYSLPHFVRATTLRGGLWEWTAVMRGPDTSLEGNLRYYSKAVGAGIFFNYDSNRQPVLVSISENDPRTPPTFTFRTGGALSGFGFYGFDEFPFQRDYMNPHNKLGEDGIEKPWDARVGVRLTRIAD